MAENTEASADKLSLIDDYNSFVSSSSSWIVLICSPTLFKRFIAVINWELSSSSVRALITSAFYWESFCLLSYKAREECSIEVLSSSVTSITELWALNTFIPMVEILNSWLHIDDLIWFSLKKSRSRSTTDTAWN